MTLSRETLEHAAEALRFKGVEAAYLVVPYKRSEIQDDMVALAQLLGITVYEQQYETETILVSKEHRP